MPRPPDTLASVWMYLCGSRMIDEFCDKEMMSAELRDVVVKKTRGKYFFGVSLGGGQERWMIDRESKGRIPYYSGG